MRKSGVSLLSANFLKIVFLTFLGVNLVVIALVILALGNIRQQIEDRATVNVQNLAYTLDQSIAGIIDKIDLALIAATGEIERQLADEGMLDETATSRVLSRQQKLLPGVSQFWATDRHGEVRYGANLPEGWAASLGGSEIFVRLSQDDKAGLVIGKPRQNPADQTWQLPFARRIQLPDGSFGGIVHGAVALDEFTRKFADLHLSPLGSIELRDAELGRIVHRTGSRSAESMPSKAASSGAVAAIGDRNVAPAYLAALHEKPGAGSYRSVVSADGGEDGAALHYYRKVGGYPLYVDVGLEESEFLGPWHKGVAAATIGLLFFTLASLFVVHLLLRSWKRQNSTVATLAGSKKALLESERRWRRIFDLSPVGAAVVAPDYRLLNVNETLCRLLGYTRDELLALDYHRITSPDELSQEIEQMQRLLTGDVEQYARECCYLGKEGQPVSAHVSMSLMRDDAGEPLYFLPMIQDIRTRKEAEEQINYLAYYDALTGLPNRLLAKDRLDHAIAYAVRENSGVGLLNLDLDHFKAINDSLGHPVGDALLKEIADRLDECVRDTDTVCRLGGDEFLIILANVIDPEIISGIAIKVQEKLGTTFKIDGHELTTSVSIGITVYPNDGKDFDSLLKKADTALYKAKESGRNTHQFYTEQMNSEAIEYLKVRNGLRLALVNEEFLLHYQPQINLADGKVVGVEALIRWRHPELGILQPSRFISIAEDSGLIVPIGDWVLKRACQQAVEWRAAGLPPIVIAVNLSAVQFKRGDIEKSVLQALHESGHDPHYLELELTESILIQDTDKALDTLHRMKAMGMKLSIDDFGTGYSSLSYLKRFNVDKLKIDQSFVRDMVDNKNDAAIVQAIIQMARSLNLQVIAEGVEDERLVAMLHHQQCNEAQGYHFARPMAPGAFVDYMASLAD